MSVYWILAISGIIMLLSSLALWFYPKWVKTTNSKETERNVTVMSYFFQSSLGIFFLSLIIWSL